MSKTKKDKGKSEPQKTPQEIAADKRKRWFSADDIEKEIKPIMDAIEDIRGEVEQMRRHGTEALEVQGATKPKKCADELKLFLGNLRKARATSG